MDDIGIIYATMNIISHISLSPYISFPFFDDFCIFFSVLTFSVYLFLYNFFTFIFQTLSLFLSKTHFYYSSISYLYLGYLSIWKSFIYFYTVKLSIYMLKCSNHSLPLSPLLSDLVSFKYFFLSPYLIYSLLSRFIKNISSSTTHKKTLSFRLYVFPSLCLYVFPSLRLYVFPSVFPRI